MGNCLKYFLVWNCHIMYEKTGFIVTIKDFGIKKRFSLSACSIAWNTDCATTTTFSAKFRQIVSVRPSFEKSAQIKF
jgi:hypothetical protein